MSTLAAAVILVGGAASVQAASPAELPSAWSLSNAGQTVTGVTPSGNTVTVTLTGALSFNNVGPAVRAGAIPAYFPPAATAALYIQSDCATAPCGTITYSFAHPVTN